MANWLFLALGGLGIGFLVARTKIEEEKFLDRFGQERAEVAVGAAKKLGRFDRHRMRCRWPRDGRYIDE